MNQKALKTLEFDKIIHILTAHAASEGAKEMCRKLVPYDNINDVERAQREQMHFAVCTAKEAFPLEGYVTFVAL